MIANKPHKIELWIFLIALFIVSFGLYYLGPSITGFVIKEFSYTDDVNLVVTSNGNYTWQIPAGDLRYAKLDGSVTTYGKARVYIESNGIKYLIFDSTRIGEEKANESKNLITGFVVKEGEDKDEDEEESDEDKKKKNHKPDWTSDVDEFIINGTTTIDLSQYFTDEDNDALIYSASEVEGLEITISNEIVTITPKSDKNFNTTITFTASDGVDIKNEVVDLIVYTIKPGPIQPNRAPIWNSETDTFIVNGTTTINLSQYFIDEDNDTLTYSSGLVENIIININNEILTLIPDDGFAGSASTVFTAYDGKNLTIKSVTLIVPEKVVVNITEPINETINITPIINKTINIDLAYKSGTIYDANDNGEESVNGIVDLTVENSEFNWDVDEEKLCTRWEVYNVEKEQLTTFCNGNNECCAFVNLLPSKANWNEAYYAVFGKDGAGYNNIVSAQVLYYDVNLSVENLKSEIYYSEWANKSVKFFEEEIEFFEECIETCSLTGLNKSTYTLIFEIEDDAVLRIDKIKYALLVDVRNNAPLLIKNFSTINVPKNKNATINLSQYFADPDGDVLSYSYYKADNISILFDGDIATILPDKGIDGLIFTYIIANDSENIAISNLFIINISEMNVSEAELKFFEIRDKANKKLAVFDSLGNLKIKGILKQNIEPIADENDFAIQNLTGNVNAAITNPEGNLLLRGNLNENQQLLIPTPNSFIIENKDGEAIAYFNSTGSLFLKGFLAENILFEWKSVK